MLKRVRQGFGHGVLDPVDPDRAQQATTESRLDTGNEHLETLLIDHATTSLTQQETTGPPTRATTKSPPERADTPSTPLERARMSQDEM